ncbi:thioredoxin-like protein [Baffinella frigidus]|nr:thioredoxin-like protein [Cryptophyta sp. CCMP2293]|mmetsp:Transcript_51954/g.123762  ORF Transcript_51954/g.123762 Transcript_51954/m.123762 type:complete len:111 (-) Transcript_51954:380-712(-)
MSVLDGISAADSDGNTVDLGAVYGNVPAVLVVNVASKCGLTSSNYTWLAALTEKFGSDKLVVLAFPCNQFGGQEPGTDGEVCAFVRKTGGAFPVMSKVDVNGAAAHPLFQ